MTKLSERAQALDGLEGPALKSALRQFVRVAWPDMPPWTTLDGPVIQEVETATAGCGAAITFIDDDGTAKVVLCRAGTHFISSDATAAYTIAGGFINLTRTPGSSMVQAAERPENPREGAAREIEEELKRADGSPLLSVDPARMVPMDALTLKFRSGERRLVNGMMLELTRDEITLVKAHVQRLKADSGYRDAVAAQTINPDSGKPEVCDVAIFDLVDVAAGRVNLLHKDQQSLFQQIDNRAGTLREACGFAPRPTVS